MIKRLNFSSRIIFILRHLLEFTLIFLLIVMTLTVFSQVIARYVFEAPLSWSEELARFVLMWLSMLSAAYAFKIKAHFALTIMVSRLSKNIQNMVAFFVQILVGIFFAIIFYYSIIFVNSVQGHTAPALQISMQVPYSSIIVSSGLITIFSFWSATKNIFRKTKLISK